MCEKSSEIGKNFNTLRQQFLRHLSANGNISDLSRSFGALNSNLERVNFVGDLLKSADIRAVFQKDSKSDEIAVKFRQQGNERFKIKKLEEAWEFYTKSICYSDENGANLGLAYANRSAVLFEMNLHKQCLIDITRAREHNFPDNLKPKLFTREKNCKNLEVENFFEDIPNVDEKNVEIHCASASLAIQKDANFGRFILAARDIKCGEILAVEKPFALLLVNQYLSHCHECMTLCYNLIPCKTCTHTLYCSENCRQQAFQNYHKYECPILATVKFLELDKLKILPLKIALLAKNEKNEHSTDLPPSDEYRSDRYSEIHNLVANTSKRSVSDLFERATAAAIIFDLVKNHTHFFETEKLENWFKEILLLHMQTGPSNFHEITELAPNSGNYEPVEIASGAFAFLSLLNHSCSPNVTRFCHGSSVVLRAIQDIKKGEQCFDNYGYHYALMKKTERQKHLRNQYYFDCVCQACQNDWGLYEDLPTIEGVAGEDEAMIELSLADVQAALIILPEMLEKLRDLQKWQPCRNFCQIQEIVKQCFAIFGNKRRLF